MKQRPIGVFCVLVALSSAVFAQSQDDGCGDVLYMTGRNYARDTLDLSVAQRVYDQYCEGDSAKRGINFDSGLSAIIQAVPFSGFLRGGTTEEQVNSFCKTFDSYSQLHESELHERSLVDHSSINAWIACKEMSARGIVFRPRLLRQSFTIEVSRKGAEPISVQGIHYDPKLLKCTVPNSQDSPHHRTSAGPDTQKELTDASWSVNCTRVPTMFDKVARYPAAEITVETTKGDFPMSVPQDDKLPAEWASQIEDRQAAVEAAVKAMQTELATIGTDVDQPPRSFTRGYPYTNLQCPSGQFLSAIAVPAWNSDHDNADVGNISVQCRKGFVPGTK
jgi:hypothetical protein